MSDRCSVDLRPPFSHRSRAHFLREVSQFSGEGVETSWMGWLGPFRFCSDRRIGVHRPMKVPGCDD